MRAGAAYAATAVSLATIFYTIMERDNISVCITWRLNTFANIIVSIIVTLIDLTSTKVIV